MAKLPDRFEPMLAEARAEPFDSPDYLFEIKWDGTRCCVFRDAAGLALRNRRHVELGQRYPELHCLRDLPDGTLVDGEIVVLDDGKPSFPKLMQREHLVDPEKIRLASERLPATLMLFDLMYDRGKDLQRRPLIERRNLLEERIADFDSPHVIVPSYVVQRGCDYFAGVERLGLEGIMAKRLQSPYRRGRRSEDWLKIKVSHLGTFAIIGFTQREGEETVSALVLGLPRKSGWIYKGKVGTGFTEHQRAEFFAALRTLPPLSGPPADGPPDAHWHNTGLVARIRYFEETETGMLRGPVFDGLTDEDPTG